ncbi:type VI secretion system-associated FHA domain protein TagH [Pseudomonas sp. X10]
MPLKLQVKTYREQPLVSELSCLVEAAASLGRAPGNDLVLDDPGKYISRVHARVERREANWYLVDIGSNPSVVNERLLGSSRETLLRVGDQVVIGDYRIEVSLQDDGGDPDQTGLGGTQTLAVFVPPPASEPKVLPPLQEAPVVRSEPGFSKPEVEVDPLAAASILQHEALFAPVAQHDDPLGLKLFGQDAPAVLPPLFERNEPEPLLPVLEGAQSDHLSPELQALPPAAPVPASALIPDGYDALADLIAAPALHEPITPVSTVAQVEAPELATPVSGESVVTEPGTDTAVLHALLAGLGLPGLRTARSPEALARLAGEMLREATGGTMGVLMARALTKRESHIEMTMIGARSNNPLKFFPDPVSALSQMLSTDAPAYLPAVQALRAAFDDLKAHELALIAGMREALSEVVQRFEPGQIERRMAAPNALQRWLPGGRKARLWDRLTELYEELVRDGDDDLQRIFGEKFSLAYQQQVARLREQP